MMIKLLFDTDLIGDDILALIAAMGLKDLKLQGITSFGRHYSSKERAIVALKLLDVLGVEDGIPVAAGANRPLLREPRQGCTGCDPSIMEFSRSVPGSFEEKITPGGATKLIIDTVKENPGEITILCTGPLINLALAVSQEPTIVDSVKNVVIMGGAAWVPGNVSPVAESNIYNDPEAAAIVFRRFNDITMVGLDVTLKTVIDEEIIEKVCTRESKIGKLTYGIISSCVGVHKERGFNKMPLHDPLAMLVAVDPTLIETEPCNVLIETVGLHTTGQTVCIPFKAQKDKCLNLTKVAVNVDADRAVKMFINAVAKVCK